MLVGLDLFVAGLFVCLLGDNNNTNNNAVIDWCSFGSFDAADACCLIKVGCRPVGRPAAGWLVG